MNILCGTLKADSGSVLIKGRAKEAGIGMVHQHPSGSRSLSVLENIILGFEPKRFSLFTDCKKARDKIQKIQRDFDLPLPLEEKCFNLTSSQIQRMELIHLLYKGRDILIFDEPTASLPENQKDHFFKIINRLKEENKTILFISHKLNEVFAMSDKIIVLRKGTMILENMTRSLSQEEVAKAMIGEVETLDYIKNTPLQKNPKEELFSVNNVSYRDSDSHYLKEICFSVNKGEILSITGIRENGLKLLEDVISGMIHPHKGHLSLKGKDVTKHSPEGLRELGISYVPADRLNRGVSRDSSIAENLILLNYNNLHKMGILTPGTVKRWAENLQKDYKIDGNLKQPVRHLSGGNIQKVILSRELVEKPELIIICEPSWGLDFKSRNRLHRELIQTSRSGTSVLMISSDLDEVLALSDRIAVMYDGQITTLKSSRDLDRQSMGDYILGLRRDS